MSDNINKVRLVLTKPQQPKIPERIRGAMVVYGD